MTTSRFKWLFPVAVYHKLIYFIFLFIFCFFLLFKKCLFGLWFGLYSLFNTSLIIGSSIFTGAADCVRHRADAWRLIRFPFFFYYFLAAHCRFNFLADRKKKNRQQFEATFSAALSTWSIFMISWRRRKKRKKKPYTTITYPRTRVLMRSAPFAAKRVWFIGINS